MITWLSRLFRPSPEAPPTDSRELLRVLRLRRRELHDSLTSLRAYGYDSIAGDDEAALKTLDRKILALQLKLGSGGENASH
ncbi:MAG TPA: hypothetical protein VE981_11045 [Planctomycetota bacterium]|nr:hypothetical protein [Planctomycetota bacterium]